MPHIGAPQEPKPEDGNGSVFSPKADDTELTDEEVEEELDRLSKLLELDGELDT